METEVNCPEPGIYEDVPFAEYAAWEAVNNSRLGQMAKSPKHYTTPIKFSTDALRFGNLCHCGRLEPIALAERYAVAHDWHLDAGNVTAAGKATDSKATRYYKERAEDFANANAGKEIVSKAEYRQMMAMVKSIDADPVARRLFAGVGPVEVSIVWDDPETGLRCKGRFDKLGPGYAADLKTTIDLATFPKSIANYSYHRQQAFYRMGWAVLNGGELLETWLVAAEKSEPFCVQAAPLSELALAQGDAEWRKLLGRVAECHEAGSWPGPESPIEWTMPAWAVVEGSRYVETETEIIAV